MDPVRDTSSNSQNLPSSMPSASSKKKKQSRRPLPDLDDDLVKPGSVSHPDEPISPKPMKSPVPNQPGPQSRITNPPPPPPPPPEKPSKESMKPATPPSGASMDTKSKVLLIVGPLFLLGAIGYSATLLLTPSSPQTGTQTLQRPAIYSQIPQRGVIEEEKATPEQYEQYAPTPPTSVRVYSDASRNKQLTSGGSFPYSNPYIEWSGAQPQEPNTSIVGYMVYFGPEVNENNLTDFSVIQNGVRVDDTKFAPNGWGIALKPNTTYRLMIQPFSDGKAKFGYDRSLQAPSPIYFEYTYKP